MTQDSRHRIQDSNPSDLLFQVALPIIPQVGGGTARTLVKYFGSAEEVFTALLSS